jgi:type III secretion protein T
MTDGLTTLSQLGVTLTQAFTVLGLCSVRLYVMLFIFPPTSDNILQGVVRNGIVLLFGSFIAYGQPESLMTSLPTLTLLEIVTREVVIGLVLGFAASTVFWVAEAAGIYVDDLTGYNNAQMTNPLNQDHSTPTGTLLAQVAGVAFWALGGMTFLLGVLYESYQWWPLTSSTPVAANVLESFVLHQTDTLMETTAKLAAPMLFILVLVDFAFGFISKSAEKLDLISLAQPVKGALTVLMLALFIGIFINQVRDELVLTGLGAQLRSISGAAKK